MAKHKSAQSESEPPAASNEQPPAALEPEGVDAIRRIVGALSRAVPHALRSTGAYRPADDDELGGAFHPVPDGAYRLVGQDCILHFAGGRLVEVTLARPPHFGGPDVVSVHG